MTIEAPTTPERQSRRAILAGALAGLAGLIAGRAVAPESAKATAGDPMLIGNTTNNAGTANTTLTTSSTGTGLLITQNGSGTALRGSAVGPGSIAGFFTAQNGTGISGVTGAPGSYGVFAQNNGAAGAAGALRASGGQNHGVVATTGNAERNAIVAISNVADGVAILASNSSAGTAFTAGSAVRGLAGGGTVANIHPATGTTFVDAAGEFAGPNGVIGASTGDINTAGVLGLGGTTGSGLWGRATGGIGVFAQSLSNDAVAAESESGIGVNSGSDTNYGVRGSSNSSDGVRGEGGANGVSGTSANASASGVYGENVDGYGVAGRATDNGIGVYGVSSNGTGVYAECSFGPALVVIGDANIDGQLDVTGNVNKAGGTFKIDHPLDAANKFLYHSFVESPDMMNIYNGIATLDVQGEAAVKLPAWFDKLNKEFRYQLTPIGPTDRILFVKSEVKGNAFAIGGGQAGQRVSWQVTGIRQDAWANAHRIVVEEAKPAGQKGKYLHPVENGQPVTKGIGYAERKAMEAKLPK